MSNIDRRQFLLLAGATISGVLPPVNTCAANMVERPRGVDDLASLSLKQASDLVRSKNVSPLELTRACLERIEKYDKRIRAFITVSKKHALQQAQVAEREIMQGGWRGPLHGIPIALKDNIDTAGIRTTAASAVFIDRVPAQNAAVVTKLDAAGAVLLGKLNLEEFAFSDGYWGPVRNPRNLEYWAGGSSSGSAAAIAADFCYGALGTDTGGSIRTPASFCGVAGLKPSYGLVSNRGAIPVADSLDHIGPLGKTALDTAMLLHVIAGHDAEWENSANIQLPDYAAAVQQYSTTPGVGVARAGFCDNLDTEVEQVFFEALEKIKTISNITNDNVVVPHHNNIFRVILQAEMQAWHAPLFKKFATLYQPALREFLTKGWEGESISATDYLNAHRELQNVRRQAAQIFREGIDLILTPTWKTPAPALAASQAWRPSQNSDEPEFWNTSPFSVLGLPALTVVCGYTKAGLPVGLQIVGRPFADAEVLAFAHRYEQVTPWHQRKPTW